MEIASLATIMEADHETMSLERSVKQDLETLKKKNLQFRFEAVENVMAPLIHQVTSLTEYKPASMTEEDTERFLLHRRQFGNPHTMVQLVNKAVMNFLSVGEDIAEENPDFQEDLVLACEEVRSKGEVLHTVAEVFVQDPSLSDKRAGMVHASRELLFSITRLMVLADIVDVNNLLNASSGIEDKLRMLLEIRNESDLMERIEDCSAGISQITQMASIRLNDTKSKSSLQMLSAAQTQLSQASHMLVSASKAFLHDPTVKAAEENREFVIEGMLKSLRTLSLLADGEDLFMSGSEMERPQEGELVASFSNFEAGLDEVTPGHTIPSQVSASLQQELGVILKMAADLADSSRTRDSRQRTIISQSGGLKAGLRTLMLLGEGRAEIRNESLEVIRKHSTTLKQELHRVSVDLVSDAFVDILSPLLSLISAAEKGNRGDVDKMADQFQEHAEAMIKAASILCSLSKDVDGIQVVKMAAKNVKTLIPQVVHAAQTLVVQPKSSVLQKNMAIFREGWMENVTLLTNSVDALTPLLDFLIVTEAHLHEDSRALLKTMELGDRGSFEQCARAMQGRCSRVAHFVDTEIRENPASYSEDKRERIGSRVHTMRSKSLASLHDLTSKACRGEEFDEIHSQAEFQRELIDTTEKLKEDVQELCREILETRSLAEQNLAQAALDDTLSQPLSPAHSVLSLCSTTSLDSLSTPRKFQRTPQHSQVFDTKDSAKSMMTQLSPNERAQLAKVTADLTAQQAKFEREAKNWDAENDIVLLAKEMCMMMMDMSDFTRGIGHLHSIMDLVITAKDIARAGEALCVMTQFVADQCPDSNSRDDLFAYMDRIKLHCHQLKITSAVKADSKTSTSETVDSASALITAAKNLMTAVVETVKTSYVASVAIARVHGGSMPDQFTQWRLTLPRQKGLQFVPDSKKDTIIHQLGQFKPGRQNRQLL